MKSKHLKILIQNNDGLQFEYLSDFRYVVFIFLFTDSFNDHIYLVELKTAKELTHRWFGWYSFYLCFKIHVIKSDIFFEYFFFFFLFKMTFFDMPRWAGRKGMPPCNKKERKKHTGIEVSIKCGEQQFVQT